MTDSTPSKSNAVPILLILVFFGVIAGNFAIKTDYVAAATAIALAVGGIAGFRSGAIRAAASIAGIVLAAALAPKLGLMIEANTAKLLGTSGLTNRAVAIGMVGLGIIVSISILAAIVSSRLFKNRDNVASWNRWTGFVFGAAQAAFATLIFLGGLLVMEPMQRHRVQSMTIANPLSKGVIATTDYTRNSILGPLIEKYNPFTQVPELNKFEQIRQSVQTFSDSKNIVRLLRHPEIQQLRKDPKMNQAMATLQQDQQISEIINSGEPMSQHKLMTIMNSDAVLHLIDQPGFVDEVSNVLTSLDPPAEIYTAN